MSLVDRFGCKISFYEFDKKISRTSKILPQKIFNRRNKGNRETCTRMVYPKGSFSGRTAIQFVKSHFLDEF